MIQRDKVILTYYDVNNEISEEEIWVKNNGDNRYIVDNIPLFAPNLSYDDIISVEKDGNILYFDELIEASDNSTLQIIFFSRNTKIEMDLLKELEMLGCQWEGLKNGQYYAINIPKNINYMGVENILKKYVDKKILDYKESCLSKVHRCI